MDLNQLRCFVAVADELHFGRAAQRLDMLPAAHGRFIRLLEEDLGLRLLARTTRSAALTKEGAEFLIEARALLESAEALAQKTRAKARERALTLRIGAIDSAAAGLLPPLLQDFRVTNPQVAVQIMEEKTIRLLPRLLSGRLDIAFVRPPSHFATSQQFTALNFRPLFHETAVVAVPLPHRLSERASLAIPDLADEPLIVPERRSRPHSHDLTMTLFSQAGLQARISQIAEEKQTIISLVGAGLGIAIVPRWTSRMAAANVRYIPLVSTIGTTIDTLPLAAVWLKNARDHARDSLIALLEQNLSVYRDGS